MGVHSDEKNFGCPQCEYKAKSQLLITKHVRRLHKKERKHTCAICGKSFFEKWNLTDHIVAVHQKVGGKFIPIYLIPFYPQIVSIHFPKMNMIPYYLITKVDVSSKGLINLAMAGPWEIFKQHLIKNEEQPSFSKI